MKTLRFIPACAGNILVSLMKNPGNAVHPRMCGEHSLPSWESGRATGSSPHVRGTCRFWHPQGLERRFIPACAGNILPASLLSSFPTVHPRMCGEHFPAYFSCGHIIGSSPHVRGTSPVSPEYCPDTRFIPACAGNIKSGNT